MYGASSSAFASLSTQTVNTFVTTPPIQNSSKQDIAQCSSVSKVVTKLHAPDQSAESSIATNEDVNTSNADGESSLAEPSSGADFSSCQTILNYPTRMA